MPGEIRHSKLLDDRKVRRWYDNIARGSKVTADAFDEIKELGEVMDFEVVEA